ncbi:ANL family adenylate-forming protein [Hippea maritima]|uniref:O-succinylbenzoate--CoA ligase n=1 Tax=Hippea maritima (strain ATCC 700847 / DSM 10411 / MH2) TaxID=760142 RepID=F2LUK8_HIPMA|nr:fatty acid--CoA ligase family protein [Hippea maritima]AEA34598.1 o-succinylbenzoate--CoA ligase [Hippea maritima DSM 10411]
MSYLIENFKKFDSKLAIIHNDKKYTYKELLEKIEKFLNDFKGKIKKGEVVAILGDYSFENIALLLALYLNKNIIVPITSTNEQEIKERLREANVDKVLKIRNGKPTIDILESKEKHNLIKNLQEQSHSGLILFSSGSTGKPKAMIHDFDNLIEHYKGKKEKNINMLIFLMFDHIGGLNTLLNILSTGAVAIIPKNRNADEVCKIIEEYKIKVLPSSPTFLNLLLMNKSYEKYDLSSLRMITYGTEPMPESLLKKLKETFPKVRFLQTFGTSETGITNTYSKSSDSTLMKIDDPDIEYKIVNGELWLRSKTQVLGYLNAPMNSFTEDGWFKTGDLVEVDKDGYIKIIGRNKDIINVGGEKVFPAEVESVILEIPEVIDCMVYGEKNSITGQTVVVDVVMKEGIDKKEAKKIIRKYCKQKLDNYKIPTKVNLVEKINFGDRFKKIRRR